MNILIYFGPQLNPQRGGTERVACMIADFWESVGHHIYYMASTPVEDKLSRQSVFLPDGKDIATPANIAFVSRFLEKKRINLILNEGASTDVVYLFSHQHLPLSVQIISHLHFSVMDDVKHFYRTLYYPLWDGRPLDKLINLLKWIKAPYNRWYALKNKQKRYQYMYDHSDKIVVLSEKQKLSMEALLNITSSSKIVAINNPLLSISLSIANQDKENVILFVGRLDFASKRVDRVLKVWRSIQKELQEWRLVIVGSGSDERRLKVLSQQMSLQRIEFTGQTDSSPFYSKAKILLLTSNYEGTPMVLAEAMASGVVPIVMNSFLDADLLIKDSVDGLLTTPFCIKELAQKVIKLAQNPQILQAMSEHAKAKMSNIDNTSILNQWIQLADGN